MLSSLPAKGVHRTIALVEYPLCGRSRNLVKSLGSQGQKLLLEFGLWPVNFCDGECGGATDARHTLGFAAGLRLGILPAPKQGLALVLCHFIDGGTEIAFSQTILQTLVPTLESSARVRWHENILLSCGLFPRQHPWLLVYCPWYRLPHHKLVIRALTLHKMLRLYQLPLLMDALLVGLDPELPLPYEDSAPPGLFTSVLHQLWGVVGGGSAIVEEGSLTGEEEVVEEDVVRSITGAEEHYQTGTPGHSGNIEGIQQNAVGTTNKHLHKP